MAAIPPIWADAAADLALAGAQASRAALKGDSLASSAADAREDREMAVGKHLHDAISAAERAIERLVEAVDGDLPRGRSSHRDLLDRAAREMPGLRPPIIGAATRRDLGRLMAYRYAFRHAYGAFDFALASPNVEPAVEAMARLTKEMEEFARRIGLLQAG
jgi:hypothetical protein